MLFGWRNRRKPDSFNSYVAGEDAKCSVAFECGVYSTGTNPKPFIVRALRVTLALKNMLLEMIPV